MGRGRDYHFFDFKSLPHTLPLSFTSGVSLSVSRLSVSDGVGVSAFVRTHMHVHIYTYIYMSCIYL